MTNQPSGIQKIRRSPYWTPGAIGGSALLGPYTVYGYKASRLKGRGKARATAAAIGTGMGYALPGAVASDVAKQAYMTMSKAPRLGRLMAAGLGGRALGMAAIAPLAISRWKKFKQQYGR